jgi:hypothetical protein
MSLLGIPRETGRAVDVERAQVINPTLGPIQVQRTVSTISYACDCNAPSDTFVVVGVPAGYLLVTQAVQEAGSRLYYESRTVYRVETAWAQTPSPSPSP